MKIAFVTNNFEPIISGITTSINSFYEPLSERGHDIYIFAPEYPNYYDRNPNVQRVFSLKLYYKEKYPAPLISSYKLAKAMRKLSIEVIHSHHPFGLGRTVLSAARKYLNIPIIFTYHTMYEEYSHYVPLPNKNYLKNYLKNSALDYTNNCDLVITPINALKDLLLKRGCKKPIEVLPTGITRDLTMFNDPLRCNKIKKKYGINHQNRVFLCVSRLAQEKNCEFLIESFSNVVYKLPKAKLLIVGTGPCESKLKHMVYRLGLSSKIIFIGSVPHSEIAAFYAIGEILLFVSQTDTQGLPLIETLHFGLPIVAVKSMASKELVGELNTGILTSDSKDEFAKAIIDLSDNYELVKQYQSHNREVAKKFHIDYLSNRLEDIYHKVLS
ncbi:MAG: 1,2-diacylglycerol 3-alpha-glucosyltransferase [Candidatus Poribacteria bacterium]|nr:1,2-diacylglycerol 3-alpha-glucosyltransferase [Candidatus Poribacteria bacterium]